MDLSRDHCDFDLPISSSQLQPAVTKAFDTLGGNARVSLLEHLRSRGIDLGDGSKRTLNQINDALGTIFSKEAAALIIEMIWNFLKKS